MIPLMLMVLSITPIVDTTVKEIVPWIVMLLPSLYILLRIAYDFIFYSKEFYYLDWDNLDKIHKKDYEYSQISYDISLFMITLILFPFQKIHQLIKQTRHINKKPKKDSHNKAIGFDVYFVFIVMSIFSIPTIWLISLPFYLWFRFPIQAIYTICGFIILYAFTFFMRWMVEIFHPLYAFWNIGEKIQKLTPTIESQSKLIQSEFEKDQNFGVLHAGFEKLSSTFSEIVKLVIKLEQVEKKANKWNLFDSDKYINSLRADIIVPLEGLQQFLEKQRDELIIAQEELSRVRVGWSDERGNRELSSTRSKTLLDELDTNIRALSEMRGKMG